VTQRRLELLPEVLPKPQTAGGASSVRARALARLSVLAALSAAHAGCPEGGAYGVVDPLPPPACFDLGLPEATARYVSGADAGEALPDDGAAGDGRVAPAASDAGDAGDAPDAGGPSADAAAPGSDASAPDTVRSSREIRVDLDFADAQAASFASAAPLRGNVRVLEQSISGTRVTLLLVAPAGEAVAVALSSTCQGTETPLLNLDLRLSPNGVEVRVSRA
jgi:hypothetical protein